MHEKRGKNGENLAESLYNQLDHILDSKPADMQPVMCQLWLHVSSDTTLETLLEIIQGGFHYNTNRALEISIDAINEGVALCCVLPKDIAETKAEEIISIINNLSIKTSITCFIQRCRSYVVRKT